MTTETKTSTEPRSSATSLAQIVAIVGGVKSRTERLLTDIHHQMQRRQHFNGLSRTYRPRNDEDTELLPEESTPIQLRAEDLIAEVATAFTRMLNVVATQEQANTRARADLVVDGVVLARDVPVTYLMWLEKKIVDLRTFVSKLPVLDVAEEWTLDPSARAWRTAATETTRTKKVMRNHVKAEATDRHPAQVEVFTEDVVVGFWRSVRYSSALPAVAVFDLMDRAERLLEAVRFAREQANTVAVVDQHIGDILVTYLLRPATLLRPETLA